MSSNPTASGRAIGLRLLRDPVGATQVGQFAAFSIGLPGRRALLHSTRNMWCRPSSAANAAPECAA